MAVYSIYIWDELLKSLTNRVMMRLTKLFLVLLVVLEACSLLTVQKVKYCHMHQTKELFLGYKYVVLQRALIITLIVTQGVKFFKL